MRKGIISFFHFFHLLACIEIVDNFLIEMLNPIISSCEAQLSTFSYTVENKLESQWGWWVIVNSSLPQIQCSAQNTQLISQQILIFHSFGKRTTNKGSLEYSLRLFDQIRLNGTSYWTSSAAEEWRWSSSTVFHISACWLQTRFFRLQARKRSVLQLRRSVLQD